LQSITCPVIQVSGIRKTYGSTVAVDDVSFAVNDGEIFGLIGPNGAGKTTTMECIEETTIYLHLSRRHLSATGSGQKMQPMHAAQVCHSPECEASSFLGGSEFALKASVARDMPCVPQ
jgi:ABC-type branched-subunit amino acid transport system ATPase component